MGTASNVVPTVAVEAAGLGSGNTGLRQADVSGKSSGKSFHELPVADETSGKTSGKPEVEDLPQDDDDDVVLGEEISDVPASWRLEQNSNGFWRWRWQKKDAYGNSITYMTTSGKRGYKRGSQYVPREEAARLQ